VLPNGSFVTFHYSSYGTFSVHSKSSIISTVVLPTTEIIEPKKISRSADFFVFNVFCNYFLLTCIGVGE
ncbi:hypothetical protein StVach60_01045, partial [Streptococcus thermophilus]|uniref:hypothetical protein n=1 Tax=Streptococcus thermophilus TaxID=1308 RepID=UPI001C646612